MHYYFVCRIENKSDYLADEYTTSVSRVGHVKAQIPLVASRHLFSTAFC